MKTENLESSVEEAPRVSRAHALLHPIRSRICSQLFRSEKTVAQIGEAMTDVPTGSIYRHLNILLDAGIVEVASEQRTTGAMTRYFKISQADNLLTPDERAELGADNFVEFIRSMTQVVDQMAQEVVESGNFSVEEGAIGGFIHTVYLTDEELHAHRAYLREFTAKGSRQPSEGLQKRFIAYFSFPQVQSEESSPMAISPDFLD